MAFKLKSGNTTSFKKMGATEAIKQVNVSTSKYPNQRKSKMDTQREIYKAKLRGDYMDLTGEKGRASMQDDPTGTAVSRDPHYLDSPNKDMKTGSYEHSFESPAKHSVRRQVAATQMEKSKIIDVEHTHSKKEEKLLKEGKLKSESIKIKKNGKKKEKNSPAKQMPPSFNIKGSSGAGERILTKQEKTANFRAEGRKTPTVRSTQVTPSGKVKVKTNMKAKTRMAIDFNYENKKAQRQTLKKVAKTGGKILKKGLKFLGGKTLGVAGLLGGGTLSATATNPYIKKSEGQQIKALLKKHKLKGGN